MNTGDKVRIVISNGTIGNDEKLAEKWIEYLFYVTFRFRSFLNFEFTPVYFDGRKIRINEDKYYSTCVPMKIIESNMVENDFKDRWPLLKEGMYVNVVSNFNLELYGNDDNMYEYNNAYNKYKVKNNNDSWCDMTIEFDIETSNGIRTIKCIVDEILHKQRYFDYLSRDPEIIQVEDKHMNKAMNEFIKYNKVKTFYEKYYLPECYKSKIGVSKSIKKRGLTLSVRNTK